MAVGIMVPLDCGRWSRRLSTLLEPVPCMMFAEYLRGSPKRFESGVFDRSMETDEDCRVWPYEGSGVPFLFAYCSRESA